MVNEHPYPPLIRLTRMFQCSVPVRIFAKRHKVCRCCDVKLKKAWTPKSGSGNAGIVGWMMAVSHKEGATQDAFQEVCNACPLDLVLRFA